MSKKFVLFVLIAVMALGFSGCTKMKYREDQIIGLTSLEIVEKYGDFDRPQGSPGIDGLYRDCSCGYLVAEKRVGFLGSTPPEYFMIDFDENGVAVRCYYEQVV